MRHPPDLHNRSALPPVDPAVVVTAYRTTKIEKYWGKP
jgi:hypothetical protein